MEMDKFYMKDKSESYEISREERPSVLQTSTPVSDKKPNSSYFREIKSGSNENV